MMVIIMIFEIIGVLAITRVFIFIFYNTFIGSCVAHGLKGVPYKMGSPIIPLMSDSKLISFLEPVSAAHTGLHTNGLEIFQEC